MSGARQSMAPSGVSSAVFVTLPTHPVYASNAIDDAFDVLVFGNVQAFAAYAWTVELQVLSWHLRSFPLVRMLMYMLLTHLMYKPCTVQSKPR